MNLPDGFEFAFPGAERHQYCIRRMGANRMLCARLLHPARLRGWIPAAQPADPPHVHADCLAVLESMFGVCPVCERWQPATDGVLHAHGGWAVGQDGPHETGEPCAGAGMTPEVER